MLPAVVAPVAIVLDTVCISQICIQHTVFPRAVVITDKIKEASDSCRPRRPRRQSDSRRGRSCRGGLFLEGGVSVCFYSFVHSCSSPATLWRPITCCRIPNIPQMFLFVEGSFHACGQSGSARTQSVLVSRRLLGGNTA